MPEFTIQAKVIGRRGALLAPLRLETDGPLETVKDLLTAIVEERVAAFEQRQAECRYLTVLTEGRCEAGHERGKIVCGGSEEGVPRVDRAAAVETVLTAFRDGFYLVFVNDVQMQELEQSVHDVREVLFLRLTPLAGG